MRDPSHLQHQTRGERRAAERSEHRGRARRGVAATAALSIALLGSGAMLPQIAAAEALVEIDYPIPAMPVTGVEAMPVMLGGLGALLMGALLLAVSRFAKRTPVRGRHTA